MLSLRTAGRFSIAGRVHTDTLISVARTPVMSRPGFLVTHIVLLRSVKELSQG